MLRRALLGVSRSRSVKNLVTRAPHHRGVVDRFVAGETTEDVVDVTRQLAGSGLLVTIDQLGEDTTEPEDAERRRGRLPGAAGPTARLRSQRLGGGVGQAHRPRALPRRRRAQLARRMPGRSVRPPATPAPRSPWTWRTTPPPTRSSRSSPSSAWTSPAPGRCSGLSPPDRVRLPRPGRTPGPGSGCARARTPSRSRWPTATGRRSTSPTCGARRS